jgi:hypothetical protein
MDAQTLPEQTIFQAFEETGRLVSTALRVQQGDAPRLATHIDDCHRLMNLIHEVRSNNEL